MNVFTRRVQSGNFPLYRLVILGILVSGVLQACYWEVPPSVSNTAPSMVDLVFAVMQSAGAAILLAGLYTKRAMLSLNLERVGGIAVATAGFMYTCAVVLNNGGLPLTAATWSIFMLSIYLAFRVSVEIPREVRAIEREALRIVEARNVE